MIRTGHVARTTAETDIDLTLCLEGSGKTSVATGFGLLDHMLTLTAFWAGFDLSLTCKGDTHIDAHHSAEDIALCLGQAFALAVGDRKGIARVGFARVPSYTAHFMSAPASASSSGFVAPESCSHLSVTSIAQCICFSVRSEAISFTPVSFSGSR